MWPLHLVYANGNTIDEYETRFGIRSLQFDPEKGLMVNGTVCTYAGSESTS